MARDKTVSVAKVSMARVSIEDFLAALSDRYPHHDMRSSQGDILDVSVPGGMISVDRPKAMSSANVAELRAYIDSLPVL